MRQAIETPRCYTDDWMRTQPDRVLYLPASAHGTDGYNDHLHVVPTLQGDLLAIWTQGSQEGAQDIRTVYARSQDDGMTWSVPKPMPGAGAKPDQVSCFGFPIVSRSGRIYCFFNQNKGFADGGHYFTGVLRATVSDDDGHTWTLDPTEIPFRRRRFDHPDRAIPAKCIIWQKPIRDEQNKFVVGFTRWSSVEIYPKPQTGFHWDSSSEFMRFENIDAGPDVKNLIIQWLPDGEPVRVPCPIEPEKSKGYCLGEEPGIVTLPHGGLFVTMRTVTGRIWYSVSLDQGHTWRMPEPLRREDSGEEMRHPKSPCPLYRLSDGRYLLFFHNHDGFSYGAKGPWDMNARRPLFISLGEYRPEAHQPIWFGEPQLFCDTQGVGAGPQSLIWLAMYASLTEHHDERIFWYPDRKHFLVGRRLTDAWLAGLPTPKGH